MLLTLLAAEYKSLLKIKTNGGELISLANPVEQHDSVSFSVLKQKNLGGKKDKKQLHNS